MITWDNYEEYLAMHTDGELSPDEERELLAFIQAHPEISKEMAVYERTRLTPDTTQAFAHKNALLKPIPQKRTITFPRWTRYSIAAGIAALIFVSILRTQSHNSEGFTKTTNTQPPFSKEAHIQQSGVNPQTAQVAALPGTVRKAVNTPGNRFAVKNIITGAHQPNPNRQIVVKAPKRMNQNKLAKSPVAETDIIAIRNDTLSVNTLMIMAAKPMPCNHEKLPVPPLSDVPGLAIETKKHSKIRTLWDQIPMNKRNKKQIENIAGFVVSAYDGIADTKQSLEEKNLNLKIKNNQLIISVN